MRLQTEAPSSWLIRHAGLIPAGGCVLDLACGEGRNARWLAQSGFRVLAADRDPLALASLQGVGGIRTIQVDLEMEAWLWPSDRFDAIVVCRYLHRPLLPALAQSLAAGGLLLYETFMTGQERLGRPRNPNFLLHPDELRHVYAESLEIIAFEQGLFREPVPSMLQRLCARKR